MTFEQSMWLIGIIFAGITIIYILAIIKHIKKDMGTKEEREAQIEEYFNNDGEIIETHAEVVDMACGTKMIGTKTPKASQWYIIVFRDDLGKIIEAPVNQEMYDGFEIGMHGTLKLVDGALYSFDTK